MVLIVALVAAGCGADPATTTTGPISPTSTAATPTPTSTQVESTTTTAEPIAMQTIQVFFATGDATDCSEVTAFDRRIEADLDPVLMAFQLLVAGPTVEEMDQGAGSFFSDGSSGAIRTITMTDDYLIIDFRDIRQLLPNASSSCGSESLLAQLNATTFQFESVKRARYEIEGSCDAFSEWLQRECEEYSRDGAQPAPLTTNERASGSGCMPGSVELPEGHWFGYVIDAATTELSFDLACWFSGSAAVDAAAEDGEESPPPNDYYIRNESDQFRTLEIAPNGSVDWLSNAGDPASVESIDYPTWLTARAEREYQPGVWLDMVDGEVVLIEEQFVP